MRSAINLALFVFSIYEYFYPKKNDEEEIFGQSVSNYYPYPDLENHE